MQPNLNNRISAKMEAAVRMIAVEQFPFGQTRMYNYLKKESSHGLSGRNKGFMNAQRL